MKLEITTSVVFFSTISLIVGYLLGVITALVAVIIRRNRRGNKSQKEEVMPSVSAEIPGAMPATSAPATSQPPAPGPQPTIQASAGFLKVELSDSRLGIDGKLSIKLTNTGLEPVRVEKLWVRSAGGNIYLTLCQKVDAFGLGAGCEKTIDILLEGGGDRSWQDVSKIVLEVGVKAGGKNFTEKYPPFPLTPVIPPGFSPEQSHAKTSSTTSLFRWWADMVPSEAPDGCQVKFVDLALLYPPDRCVLFSDLADWDGQEAREVSAAGTDLTVKLSAGKFELVSQDPLATTQWPTGCRLSLTLTHRGSRFQIHSNQFFSFDPPELKIDEGLTELHAGLGRLPSMSSPGGNINMTRTIRELRGFLKGLADLEQTRQIILPRYLKGVSERFLSPFGVALRKRYSTDPLFVKQREGGEVWHDCLREFAWAWAQSSGQAELLWWPALDGSLSGKEGEDYSVITTIGKDGSSHVYWVYSPGWLERGPGMRSGQVYIYKR
ncbi:hypothetical protein KJ903_00605 [Patescibacteria group bacterium]|nr:hypothetical protein [Patescibacteria group bacterium]